MTGAGRGDSLARSSGPVLLGLCATIVAGHSGPPFPIVSDRLTGPYRLSIWTDPDATDDGTPGGQFWLIVHSAGGAEPSRDTRVTVAVRPLDGSGAEQRASATPQPGASSRYFSSLVLDHEGEWHVEVFLEGAMGAASANAQVAATYDLRPPIGAVPFLILPFLLVGLLWLKALSLRRGQKRAK